MPPSLVGRVPLTAQRLTYLGPEPEAFAAACQARNPKVEFVEEEAEVLVLADLADLPLEDAVVQARRLDINGCLVTTSRSGPLIAELLAALGEDFQVIRLQSLPPGDDHFNDAGVRLSPADVAMFADRDLLVVARKLGTPAPEPLFVQIAAFAPRLMDIRTRLPAHALRSDPELVVAYGGAPVQLLPLAPEIPKILVLQRPILPSYDVWRAATANSIRRGWLPVLEIDDHPVLLAGGKLPPAEWPTYGFPHAVQTSTERLARVFGKYNPVVKVFPNAVFHLPPFPTEPAPRRVFYGAVARGKFAARVAASLGAVAEEFPEVEFVVVGDREVFNALPATNKSFHDYQPYEAYLELMATCAVSLSPVEGRPFEDTKSDAKFLDAAARGVVTLASPTIYAETIRHGETGLIAPRLNDWSPLLGQALRDEPARQAMARRAWEYVRDERMFAHQAGARRDWYRELWARRDELNAGVISRLPGLAQALA